MHRQPCGCGRSVHQRIPWHARHHEPGHGGVASAELGIRANPGGRSLIPGYPSLDCGAHGSGAVSKSGGYAVAIRTSATTPITARKTSSVMPVGLGRR
jgi:hypothetical protein